MKREPNIGEKALDKAVEVALTSQFDEVEQIDIDIRTDPGKLVQGKVESVAIVGGGMVIKQDLRVEALELHADAVEIDPLKAILGEIKFTQPTDAHAQILLTEADLNRALASEYLQGKMKSLRIENSKKPIVVDIQHIHVRLLSNNQVELEVNICETTTHSDQVNKTKVDPNRYFSAIVRPFLEKDGQCINFEVLSAQGQGLSLTFIAVLFEQIVELLDLRNFDPEGWILRLLDLDVQEGKLLIRATTTIEKLEQQG